MLFGMRTGRKGPAFLCHLHGRAGNAGLGDLDHQRQQLDADPRRVLRSTARASSFRHGSWAADHLQPQLSLSARPYGHRRLSHHRVDRRRRRRPGICSRSRRIRYARLMFSMAMWMAALVAPLQILAGDQQGLNTLAHQPAKVLAMEGDFDLQSRRRAAGPVRPAGPDRGRVGASWRLEIPKLGSLILEHDPNSAAARPQGLSRADDWPPVAIVFWSFRIMVGLGLLMLALGLCEPRSPAHSRTALRLAAACTGPRWRWRRPASSPSSPAGSPPRSGASPRRFMACCAPPIRSRRSPHRRSHRRLPASSWSISSCSLPGSVMCCG